MEKGLLGVLKDDGMRMVVLRTDVGGGRSRVFQAWKQSGVSEGTSRWGP